jgi:hypothetical protein
MTIFFALAATCAVTLSMSLWAKPNDERAKPEDVIAYPEGFRNLWRPANQINIPLGFFVRGMLIVCFALIYALLVKEKSFASGIRFGALFGLAISVSIGFGAYIHMPIPLTLAWDWFFGGWIKAIVASAIAGALVK